MGKSAKAKAKRKAKRKEASSSSSSPSTINEHQQGASSSTITTSSSSSSSPVAPYAVLEAAFHAEYVAALTRLMELAYDPQTSYAKVFVAVEELKAFEEESKEQQERYGEEAATNDNDNLERFVAWMEQCNLGMQDGLRVDVGLNEGNGIVATRDIEEGEMLFRIARKHMLCTEDALQDKVLGPLLMTKLGSSLLQVPTLLLALQLMMHEEMGDESPFDAFIGIVPRVYTTPLYWAAADFAHFAGSPAHYDLVQYHRSMCQKYAFLVRLNDSSPVLKQPLTWHRFRWALSAVTSRGNVVPGCTRATQDTQQLALIPGWDMLNHEFGTANTHFDMEGRVLECWANRPYSQGDQVYMHYGDRDNTQLLINAGFVLPHNPFSGVAVKLPPVDTQDPLLRLKITWLRDMPQDLVASVHESTAVEHLASVWAYARLWAMDQDCTDVALDALDANSFNTRLSKANDDKAFQVICDACDKRRATYSTSLDKDVALAADDDAADSDSETRLSPAHRLALTLLIQEKQLIDKLVELAAEEFQASSSSS